MIPFGRHFPLILILLLILTGCEGLKNLVRNNRNTPPSQNEARDPQELQAEFVRQYMDAISAWDYAEAQRAIDELRDLPMQIDITFDFSQAYLFLRLGRYDDALELVDSLEPDIYTSDLLQLRAEIYQKMHRLDEAKSDLRNFLEARPDDQAYSLFLLREIAMEQGDTEKVSEYENLLFEDYPIHRYTLFTRFYKAVRELDFRLADEVLERISTSRLLDETGEDVTDYYSIYILFARAEIASEQGDYQRSVEILTSIADRYPLATSSWQVLAWLGLAYGNITDARNWSIEGIIRSGGTEILDEIGIVIPGSLRNPDPDPGPLRNDDVAVHLTYLGHTSLMTGAFDEALECAVHAIEINPYFTSAYSLKSSALEMKGDSAGAVEALTEGLRVNPSSDILVCEYSRLYDAVRTAIPPTAPDPAPMLDKILVKNRNLYESCPMNPDEIYNLALIRETLGENDNCDLFREAHEIIPGRFDYALSYAWCLADSGDSETAVSILENFNIPLDLPWLIRLYDHAKNEANRDSLVLADWIRSRVDPYGRFNEILDPHSDPARNAVDMIN